MVSFFFLLIRSSVSSLTLNSPSLSVSGSTALYLCLAVDLYLCHFLCIVTNTRSLGFVFPFPSLSPSLFPLFILPSLVSLALFSPPFSLFLVLPFSATIITVLRVLNGISLALYFFSSFFVRQSHCRRLLHFLPFLHSFSSTLSLCLPPSLPLFLIIYRLHRN